MRPSGPALRWDCLPCRARWKDRITPGPALESGRPREASRLGLRTKPGRSRVISMTRTRKGRPFYGVVPKNRQRYRTLHPPLQPRLRRRLLRRLPQRRHHLRLHLLLLLRQLLRLQNSLRRLPRRQPRLPRKLLPLRRRRAPHTPSPGRSKSPRMLRRGKPMPSPKKSDRHRPRPTASA